MSDKSVDLILLDIEMPVLNGFDTAMEIRRREATGELLGHIPIIAVTGNARREYVDRGTFNKKRWLMFSFGDWDRGIHREAV